MNYTEYKEAVAEKGKIYGLSMLEVLLSLFYMIIYMTGFFKTVFPMSKGGNSRLRYIINYPIAYTKFMILSFKDWRVWIKQIISQ